MAAESCRIGLTRREPNIGVQRAMTNTKWSDGVISGIEKVILILRLQSCYSELDRCTYVWL